MAKTPSQNAFFARYFLSFSAIGFRIRGLRTNKPYPELHGQRILITGASAGLGRAIAMGCAKRGAEVIAVGLETERDDNPTDFGAGSITEIVCDLSEPEGIEELLAELGKRDGPLDALVNNVGVLRGRYRANRRGRELSYAINLLYPYQLTEQLQSRQLLKGSGTIINMASGGLYTVPKSLAALEQSRESFDGVSAYASQKRILISLSDAWNDSASQRRAYTMHPGWVATEGVRRSMPEFSKVMKSVLRSPTMGADTALWLLASRPQPTPGALWFDRKARPGHVYAQTRVDVNSDTEILARLAEDADRDFAGG